MLFDDNCGRRNCAITRSWPTGPHTPQAYDVHGRARIDDGNVLNEPLMAVFQFRERSRSPAPEENFNQFAAYKVGMPVLPSKLRHHSPDIRRSRLKCVSQRLDGRPTHRRPIDQCDHRCIAAMVEHFGESDLQGMNCPRLGSGLTTIDAALA